MIGSVDVAMVMLYTPWCVQCVKLAKVFVEAARRQNEVIELWKSEWDYELMRTRSLVISDRMCVFQLNNLLT